MTEDSFYGLIEEVCEKHYWLTDKECGLPYIRREDVMGDGTGRFAVRFRLPVSISEEMAYWVADEVCRKIGCKRELYMDVKQEYGLPFWDCAWIVEQ